MGYLVSIFAIKGTGQTGALHQLPKSLPWKLYRAKGIDALLLDVLNFRASPDANAYPFCSIPAIQDLPLNFEPPLAGLNDLYEALKKKNRANGFRRAFVNLNVMITRFLGAEVLSLLSDDQGIDLACVSSNGALRRLRFRAGGIEVKWVDGSGTTQERQGSSLIHRIAREEAVSFLGSELPIFGFDGDVSALGLEVVDMSAPSPPPPPKPPRGGWAAYERKQRELARAQKKWWQFWK
jgi:hypothetical protein